MAKQVRYPLGRFRRRTYYLLVRVAPDFNDVEDFATTVFYRNPADARNVEVARIDTSHGYPHFDRLYHRERPKDHIDVGVWEAVDLLETNWRRYARSHDRAHGG